MIEINEILYRWSLGVKKKAIARTLNISRNTVRQIVANGMALGLAIGDPVDKVNEVVSLLQSEKIKQRERPSVIQENIKLFHEQIKVWIDDPHMTVPQIIRLFSEQKVIFKETSLREYIRKNFESKKISTVHLEIPPGQAQVDFGYAGLQADPQTGKQRKAYAFIMTLAYSRYRFVYFVFNQNTKTWIDCHIRAFRFFQGVPKTIILDNLKAGIMKPDIYDPRSNRSYGELERFYRFIIDPAKVRMPRHKGRVERSVTIVRQQILAGRKFKNIDEMNCFTEGWCRNIIAHQITRTTGQTPWDRFENVERQLLTPLPDAEFEHADWEEALVHRDHHIVFKGSFYSVPTLYIGKTVWIRAGLKTLKIFLNEDLIKTHLLSTRKGEWVSDTTDYPEQARQYITFQCSECLEEAKRCGESVHEIISKILEAHSHTHQRKAQAILRLAKKYGSERLELACKRALYFDNTEYNSIVRILEQGLEGGTFGEEPEMIHSKIPSSGVFLRSPKEFSPEELV